MSGDWLAMGAIGALAVAGAARRRGSAAADLASLDLVEIMEKPGPGKQPVRWATGVPVRFQFARNTEPSGYFGERYAQDVEPAGRYVVTLGSYPKDLPPGWIHGDLHFVNPIVLASVWPVELEDGTWGAYSGVQGWKHKLSAAFGGKRGKALTNAILAAGYDGIVTVSMSGPRHRPGYVSEMVDLRTMGQPKRPRRGGRNTALIRQVQANLTPDLLSQQHQGSGRGRNAGHCYVASQALWHLLGGKQSGFTPQVGPAPGGGTHWWLRGRTGRVLDPTADQFPAYNYTKGVGKGFLTAEPSKRARTLIERIKKGSAAFDLDALIAQVKRGEQRGAIPKGAAQDLRATGGPRPALLVFHATTRGGKHQIHVTETGRDKAGKHHEYGAMLYSIKRSTSGRSSGASSGLDKQQVVDALRRQITDARQYDGINYIVKLDELGVVPAGSKAPQQQRFNDAFKRWFGQSKVVDSSGRPLIVFHGSDVDEPFEAFDPALFGQKQGGNIDGFYFASRAATADAYRPDSFEIKPQHAEQWKAMQQREKEMEATYLADFNKHFGTAHTEYSVLLKDAQDEIVFRPPDDLDRMNDEIRRIRKAVYNVWEDQESFGTPKFWTRRKSGLRIAAYLSLQDPLVIDAKGAVWSRDFESHLRAVLSQEGDSLDYYDGLILKNFYDGEIGLRDDIYVAFSPEQIKVVNNRGTWDPADPRMSFNRRTR